MTKWARPSYTSQQVIAERKAGLKALDKAVAKVGMRTIIDDAIKLHNDPAYSTTWGPQTCWSHFMWCFGNVWRDVIGYRGQCSFNLHEALSTEELIEIKQKCGIQCDHMTFGNPRINGIRYYHCQMHDNPENYACR